MSKRRRRLLVVILVSAALSDWIVHAVQMSVPVGIGMSAEQVQMLMGTPTYDTRLTAQDPEDSYHLIYDRKGFRSGVLYVADIYIHDGVVARATSTKLVR